MLISLCRLPAVLLTLALLSACATSGGRNVSSFNQLDLAPGDTGTCISAPCKVTLQMPAGKGSFEVTANQISLGTFPAGQKADLGSFDRNSVIEIHGSDAAKTYVYMSHWM